MAATAGSCRACCGTTAMAPRTRRSPPMWPARRSPAMLIVTLTFAILVAPLAAEAPPAGKVHRIGWLHYGGSPSSRLGGAFRQGLRDLGWVEGQNLVIEER